MSYNKLYEIMTSINGYIVDIFGQSICTKQSKFDYFNIQKCQLLVTRLQLEFHNN